MHAICIGTASYLSSATCSENSKITGMTLNLRNLCFWVTQELEKLHSCIKYSFIRFCLLNNQELAGWVFNGIRQYGMKLLWSFY